MSIGTPPPMLPPQLSPDGKWIWDGHQWQPLPETTWEPAAEAVIPQAVAAAAPAQERVPASPVEVYEEPAAVSYPAADYPAVAYPVADYPRGDMPATPLWVEPARSGLTIYMYAGAAAVVLIMLMMVLNTTNIIQLPWPGSSSSAGQTDQRSPRPQGSDYTRADRYVNFYLAPAVLSIGHTLPTLQSACTGTLSSGCLSALNAARAQATDLLSNLDHGNAPPCIAAGAGRTRADFQSMADGLDLSLKGYQDNNGAEVYQGIYHFAYVGRSLKPDAGAITAQKAHCSKTISS